MSSLRLPEPSLDDHQVVAHLQLVLREQTDELNIEMPIGEILLIR
jgi:hypothetical protein